MGMEFVECTIEGTTPLLCNKFTDAAMGEADTGTRTSIASGDRGTPREQAIPKLYYRGNKPSGRHDNHEDGKHDLVIPGPNILRCIQDGGKFFKQGRSKITTQRNSLIPACVSVAEIEVPLQFDEPWDVDIRAIVNPTTRGRRGCARPRFNNWRLTFRLEIDNELMTSKFLREIIDSAGKRIGLGDFRPDRSGPFGKFVVTQWDAVKDSSTKKPGTKKTKAA